MATFTSLGVGSGLDLNTIVTKLVALERQPLGSMQSKANQLQTQVSSFGQISSLMSGMQTAANALTNPLLWSGSTAASSDASTVAVSASNNVAPGNYAVSVQSLANSQTLASATTFPDSSALLGSGTLTLQLGTWDSGQANFSPKSGSSAVDIQIAATDTLTDVANKVNGAGAGVTASLITDSSGVRLSLRSTATGASNGFRLTAADSGGHNTDGLGLSVMAFDPPNGATAMQLMQGSTDAKATVNGIAVTSASNAMTGVIDGLTLNLNKVSSTPVNVTATLDTGSVQTAIKTFASAYNAMVTGAQPAQFRRLLLESEHRYLFLGLRVARLDQIAGFWKALAPAHKPPPPIDEMCAALVELDQILCTDLTLPDARDLTFNLRPLLIDDVEIEETLLAEVA